MRGDPHVRFLGGSGRKTGRRPPTLVRSGLEVPILEHPRKGFGFLDLWSVFGSLKYWFQTRTLVRSGLFCEIPILEHPLFLVKGLNINGIKLGLQ
ncbi:unnamed protein product [Sphenostylis stenocarpa]|uniref:Uncharacterized protein n=1 Tax=Sphenostylis stenocarpa TaxID=92480 RepID=A0AA86SJ42_9FABA|nr:unnamed protein product [Sphenostylis stenocarpa]